MTPHQQKLIEELYLDKYESLFSYAQACLQNNSLAEEAVQETFRIACTKPDSICDVPNTAGWLIITLKNVILNTKRQRAAAGNLLAEYIDVQADNIGVTIDSINVDLIYSNVADSEEFRLIKELVLNGHSVLELAEARGITVDACQKRIQRARKKLQKRIK